MTVLKNIRIGGKLALGFGILLVITVIIAYYGSRSLLDVDSSYSDVIGYPIARYQTLLRTDLALMDIRRIVALSALNTGDQAALDVLSNELAQNRANISAYVASFRYSLDNDPVFDPAVIAERRNQIQSLELLIYGYIDGVASQVINLARAGQPATGEQAEAIAIINQAQATTFHDIYTQFYFLLDEMQEYMDQINEGISSESESTLYTLIAFASVSVIIGVLVAIVITKLITKPVSEVVDALENVAHGNLNVNIRVQSKDETGILAKSAQTLVATLRQLISDMDHMADDHDKGEIDTFIDSANFDGDYGTVAEKINDMMKSSLDTQDKVVGTFMAIADGDFAADMEQLPGKKAKLNVAVNDMRGRIQAVSSEINALIDAAAVKGDLEVHIDGSKYSGGWREIMDGLNNLALAVDKPVIEIRNVMERLGKGLFDMHIEGDYPGDFKVIKDGVNTTIDSLNSYITEMGSCLSDIAGGLLTTTITREYIGDFAKIKDSINNISDRLRKSMEEISSASTNVLLGSQQISTSAIDLANGSNTQAVSLEELNSSVEFINQQTQQFAQNSKEATELSTRSSDNAKKGNEAMQQMLEAMNQIKDSSNNISKIIKVIQDIAFQTNLLSLNASVEAARAGEHGKGFAVVAEEVRNLAARSQNAAAESTQLIEDSITRVESGAEIAQVTSDSLNTLVDDANEVLALINNISKASTEQADMVAQVSQVLLQTANQVQSNSAFSEESAAAAEELNSQAEVLKQLVSYFKL